MLLWHSLTHTKCYCGRTGEEDEERLFCERAKLFRFDADTKQWKERGIGEMKILWHVKSGKVRVLMRREQVLKLCANHVVTPDMTLTPMAGSDKAWCWVANDYSEEEVKLEQLAVKFKSTELAQKFKEAFEEARKKEAVPVIQSVVGRDTKKTEKSQPSLAEMFKPKPGQWECGGCMVRNAGDVLKCPACATLKPGVKPEDVKETGGPFSTGGTGFNTGGSGFNTGGTGFKIGGTPTAPTTGGFKFGSTTPSTGKYRP